MMCESNECTLQNTSVKQTKRKKNFFANFVSRTKSTTKNFEKLCAEKGSQDATVHSLESSNESPATIYLYRKEVRDVGSETSSNTDHSEALHSISNTHSLEDTSPGTAKTYLDCSGGNTTDHSRFHSFDRISTHVNAAVAVENKSTGSLRAQKSSKNIHGHSCGRQYKPSREYHMGELLQKRNNSKAQACSEINADRANKNDSFLVMNQVPYANRISIAEIGEASPSSDALKYSWRLQAHQHQLYQLLCRYLESNKSEKQLLEAMSKYAKLLYRTHKSSNLGSREYELQEENKSLIKNGDLGLNPETNIHAVNSPREQLRSPCSKEENCGIERTNESHQSNVVENYITGNLAENDLVAGDLEAVKKMLMSLISYTTRDKNNVEKNSSNRLGCAIKQKPTKLNVLANLLSRVKGKAKSDGNVQKEQQSNRNFENSKYAEKTLMGIYQSSSSDESSITTMQQDSRNFGCVTTSDEGMHHRRREMKTVDEQHNADGVQGGRARSKKRPKGKQNVERMASFKFGNLASSASNRFTSTWKISFLFSLETIISSAYTEIATLSSRLQSSESYLVNQLTLCVKSSEIRKELMQLIRNYSNLRIDAERKIHSISNDLYTKHLEIFIAQEEKTKENLRRTISQNIKLQHENRELMAKNTSLVSDKSSLQNKGYICYKDEHEERLAKLQENNKELEYDINQLISQFENLNGTMIEAQKVKVQLKNQPKESFSNYSKEREERLAQLREQNKELKYYINQLRGQLNFPTEMMKAEQTVKEHGHDKQLECDINQPRDPFHILKERMISEEQLKAQLEEQLKVALSNLDDNTKHEECLAKFQEHDKELVCYNNQLIGQLKTLKESMTAEKELKSQLEEQLKVAFSKPNDSKKRDEYLTELQERNKELEYGINQLIGQFEILKETMIAEQDLTAQLEGRLKEALTKLNESKVTIEDVKMEFSFKLASLSHEIEIRENLVNESLSLGEVLLEDMLKLKEKLAPLIANIVWNPKVFDNSLAHLLHISRSFINELGDQLLAAQKEKETTNKEREIYLDENKKLKDVVKESEEKIKALLEEAEERLKIIGERERQAKIIVQQNNDIDYSNKKLSDALEDIDLLKEQVSQKEQGTSNLKMECENLRYQVDGLSQILLASGAGDIARELASTSEKMILLQSEHQQTVAERNKAIDQLKYYESEREALQDKVSKSCEIINDQSVELKHLRTSTIEMKEELAQQNATLTALQNERLRHLEEKNFLSLLFNKLEDEFNRMEQMEGSLMSMNCETSKLAIIAEYNKQLGIVLQQEVVAKDMVISELQKNVKALNDMQKENIQDKVALCEELTVACSLKEVLTGKLNEQMKKSELLSEVQKKMEVKTSQQLQEVTEKQNLERNSVKELLIDFDSLVSEKEELRDKLKKAVHKIESLRLKNKHLNNKANEANQLIYEKICITMDLEKQVLEKEKRIQQLGASKKEELTNIKAELEILTASNNKVNNEKEALQNSVDYLKNNVQRLQNDLNRARESEKESKEKFQKESQNGEKLQTQYNEQFFALEFAHKENDRLGNQLQEMSREFNKLEAEHNALAQKCNYGESITSKELESKSLALKQCDEEIKKLAEEINAKSEKISCLEQNHYSVEKLYEKLSKDFESVAVENRELKNSVLELTAERETLTMRNASLDEDMIDLNKKLNRVKKTSDEERSRLEDQIQKLHEEYSKQVFELEENVRIYTTKYEKSAENITKEKYSYEKLEESHKDLAQKLLRSVHLLIDEKLARQTTENKLNDVTQRLEAVESEKLTKLQKLETANEELSTYKKKAAQMVKEGGKLANSFAESKKLMTDMQTKYQEIQIQLTECKEKCKQLKERNDLLVAEETRHKQQIKEVEDRVEELKFELESKHTLILNLQDEIAALQQDITILEFERCELEIRLHDTDKELERAQKINNDLKQVNERTLSAVFRMRDQGIIKAMDCECLLSMIHNSDVQQA